MNALSRLVVRRRWWVLASWAAAIVVIQLLSSSVGGANYNDDSKLPGTETQAVSDLLANAGLQQQKRRTNRANMVRMQ